MNICIISNGFPDKREPQWGCFERDQAVALKNAGHDVTIIYVDKRFRKYWRKIGLTHKTEEGIEVYGYFLAPMKPIRRINQWLRDKLVSWMYDHVFRVMCKSWGIPDVIYAHYIFNIYYGAELKKKYNVPCVGIEHWSGLTQDTLSQKSYEQGKFGYTHVDKLLAVSKSLRMHIKRHYGIDSIVVHDMLGPEFISTDFHIKERDSVFRFIAVGSLLPIKGYNGLISAFAKSGLADQDCKLSIVGDGVEHATLEKRILDLKLQEKVELLGRKTKEEIVRLLAESHIFVLSSKAETFGVACIEALSHGLPVIATKCGGPEEIVDNSNGILVETENEDAMAEAMKDMYEDYDKYDRVSIAKSCLSKFAPNVIADQLIKIFHEVIKR